ncbi:MAG: PadR family transcriptional regulator [Planctomycetota bacterium]
MPDAADILPGTLDLMILAVLAGAPEHGYGIARAIHARSGASLLVEEGTLYPALRRLEKKGLLEGAWRQSEANRRARYYTLSAEGSRRLAGETDRWKRSAGAVERVIAGVAPGPQQERA